MKTLCLNMIVKNESHIIETTLENIIKYFNIDYWVISDTGSTDNTIELIENFFHKKNIKGEIVKQQWIDFSYNRNRALEVCWGKADYILIFDADDLIQGDLNIPELTKDGYYLKMKEDEFDIEYTRRLIIKNDKKYRWEGVVHEILEPIDSVEDEIIKGDYNVLSRRIGSRNNDKNKSLNDALLLEKAFLNNDISQKLKARYAFYCARSYFAYALVSGDDTYLLKSIKWFEERLKFNLKDDDQNKYIVYENLGILYEKTEQYDKAINAWVEGTDLDPDRAECWYDLTRYYNNINDLKLAYKYGMQGIQLPVPEHTNHILNIAIYNYGMAYELCIIFWKMRNLEKAYFYFKKALKYLPENFLENFDHIVKSFKNLIQHDSKKEIENLTKNLKRLNYSHILDFEKYPTLCLNMIVKNESGIIIETLNCLCKYFDIDYWVISDTGSTDNTITLIKNFFKDKNIPGELHQNEWVDFEFNRNKALELCESKADYILFFDADDLLEGDLFLPKLTADSYTLKFKEENESLSYSRRLIIKNNKKYIWKGVLHEVLIEKDGVLTESLENILIQGNYSVVSRHIGDRNTDPNRIYKDISVLENAFKNETDYLFKSRYAFYCAKCYLGLALKEKKYINKAIFWFKIRLDFIHDISHIDDELYCSLLNLGVLYSLKNDTNMAIYYWIKGTEMDEMRAECWQSLASLYYKKTEYKIAYEYSMRSVNLPLPESNRLFVNRDIYEYYALLEMCLICSKMNKIQESYSYFKKLLPKLPKKYLRNLRATMPKYIHFIKKEDAATLNEFRIQFERLGRQYYLDGLLRSV